MARVPLEERRRALYRSAAAFINDAGMTWSEFWQTPRDRLGLYAEACEERAREQKEALERPTR